MKESVWSGDWFCMTFRRKLTVGQWACRTLHTHTHSAGSRSQQYRLPGIVPSYESRLPFPKHQIVSSCRMYRSTTALVSLIPWIDTIVQTWTLTPDNNIQPPRTTISTPSLLQNFVTREIFSVEIYVNHFIYD